MRKAGLLWRSLGAVVILGMGIQIVPYGHARINPPVHQEPTWNNPVTRDLAIRACYDCHSNQTIWPWYSQVAPVSWLIQRDVDVGRRRLNFSEWDRPKQGTRNLARRIERGSMPPWYYRLMHSGAKLSDGEKQALVQGLQETVRQNPPLPTKAGGREGEGREG